jgi:hypothetical protein
VSFSLVKLGDVLLAQDELAGALDAYRESLNIRRALAEGDPGHAGLRRELCVSLNKLGDVHAARGHIADARAAYGESRDISDRFGDPMAPRIGAGDTPAAASPPG